MLTTLALYLGLVKALTVTVLPKFIHQHIRGPSSS